MSKAHMNKQLLVEWVQKDGSCGETKAAAERAVNAVLTGITNGLKKYEKVSIVGFGSFRVTKTNARMGRNPQTGEPIKIKASKTVKFKAGASLRDRVK